MSVGWWALGVSILAILITLTRDFIKPWIFKPDIKIVGTDDGECVENATDISNNFSRWVRLKLINSNSRFSVPAKQCYVKLLAIQNEKGYKILPFNPVPLAWVYYDEFEGKKHDLSIGEYHLIDLVHEYPDERIIKFKVTIPINLHKNSKKLLGPGKYTFIIGVYGNNFKTIYQHFKIKLTKRFGELNFIE